MSTSTQRKLKDVYLGFNFLRIFIFNILYKIGISFSNTERYARVGIS